MQHSGACNACVRVCEWHDSSADLIITTVTTSAAHEAVACRVNGQAIAPQPPESGRHICEKSELRYIFMVDMGIQKMARANDSSIPMMECFRIYVAQRIGWKAIWLICCEQRWHIRAFRSWIGAFSECRSKLWPFAIVQLLLALQQCTMCPPCTFHIITCSLCTRDSSDMEQHRSMIHADSVWDNKLMKNNTQFRWMRFIGEFYFFFRKDTFSFFGAYENE